jgi:hypothetical protein
MDLAEIERPGRGLKLLDAGGLLLPSLEIHGKVHAGNSVGEAIGLGDDPTRVAQSNGKRLG